MESTGVYWTDMESAGSDWIAQLLQHGLLRGSFAPEPSIRKLRDLNRQRLALIGDAQGIANRVQTAPGQVLSLQRYRELTRERQISVAQAIANFYGP
jgi:hypothetical protein